MERCGAQVVSFVVSIVPRASASLSCSARPIALITVITSILQVFVDSGMANALIQKKDTDDLDYSLRFLLQCRFLSRAVYGLFFRFSAYQPDIRLAPTLSRSSVCSV